jgi:hypothetical protein
LSRNKRYKNKLNKDNSTSNPPRKQAQDSFQNPLARLGMGSNSLLEGTRYPIQRMTRDYNLMNSLYRNSWIAKKIINTIPEDMCKNWFSISAELTPEIQDRFDKLEQRTLIKEKIVEGLTWGRLYGGAGAIMLIEGHEDILDEPLNLDDVMPNSFKGLMILDRWSGIYPGIELITDINDPEFGLPEFYEIKDIDGKIKQRQIMCTTGMDHIWIFLEIFLYAAHAAKHCCCADIVLCAVSEEIVDDFHLPGLGSSTNSRLGPGGTGIDQRGIFIEQFLDQRNVTVGISHKLVDQFLGWVRIVSHEIPPHISKND